MLCGDKLTFDLKEPLLLLSHPYQLVGKDLGTANVATLSCGSYLVFLLKIIREKGGDKTIDIPVWCIRACERGLDGLTPLLSLGVLVPDLV